MIFVVVVEENLYYPKGSNKLKKFAPKYSAMMALKVCRKKFVEFENL
jgi:hypothetical protein